MLSDADRAVLEAARRYVEAKQALIKARGKARQPLQIKSAEAHLDLFAAVAALEMIATKD